MPKDPNLPALRLENASEIEISVDPEAIAIRNGLLERAKSFEVINGELVAEIAGDTLKEISTLRRQVEKSRKDVKNPVVQLGKRIDVVAREFCAEVVREEMRLKQLVTDYHLAQERKRVAEIEEAKRREREEQERLRKLAEEAKAKEVASFVPPEDQIKTAAAVEESARAAADARADTRELERTKASEGLSNSGVGVSYRKDFVVVDIAKLYEARPDLVALSPKRREILEALKSVDSLPGIVVENKAVVRS